MKTDHPSKATIDRIVKEHEDAYAANAKRGQSQPQMPARKPGPANPAKPR